MLSSPNIGYYLGIGPLRRSMNDDTYKDIQNMNVDDTVGLFGSHLSQVIIRTSSTIFEYFTYNSC